MTHGMQGTGLSLGTCTGWQHVAGLSWAWPPGAGLTVGAQGTLLPGAQLPAPMISTFYPGLQTQNFIGCVSSVLR